MEMTSKKIDCSIVQILKPYLVSAMLFILAGWIFNTVETISFWKYQDSTSFSAIVQSYFNITTVFCLYAFIILPFYFLLALLKQKPAQIVASVLFSILTLLEIGLFIYYKLTGVLMGAELVARPVSDTLTTIRNSSNIFINSILIFVVVLVFTIIPFVLKKVKIFNRIISLTVGIVIIGVLSVCVIFYQSDKNKSINNYLESKSFYFFNAVKDYFEYETDTDYFIYDEKERGDKIEKNETLLKKYAELYPHRTIPDLDYPMERPSVEVPDVLSPYFHKSEKQPNVVIVIVESLSRYIVGEKGKNVSFTPFLDSLANVGLYWKNCLATTPRTFGVVPSVIGSVPHGIKGFQFGIMPNHHSLFTILKDNNYSVNFFYGGDPNFDNMLDFLTVQEPDHIDNFLSQIGTYQKKDLANYWALYDHVLFDESFKYLKNVPPQKPKVNVYLTLTTHEPFYGGDRALKKIYEPKTEKIFSKLNSNLRKYLLPVKDIIVPVTYLDDCMRDFINNYSKQPDFENTIFIITGDHAYGVHKNDLAHYSVPLIIWSPLLKTHQNFPNIVSHLAITPSVISFLQHNYNLEVPDNIAWCSDGLDTVSVYNPTEKILFLSYDRKVSSMVFGKYFFEYQDKQLYEIDENMDLETVDDALLMENITANFNTLKYINNYVYHNDKLIKQNNVSDNEYEVIKSYENKDTIVCKTPDTIPAIHGIDVFDLLPVQKIPGKYNKIKIKFMADIVINDLVYQDYHMNLNFICLGKNYEYASKENITKYIADDTVLCDKKYELFIEKEIDVSDLDKFSVHICVTSNEDNEHWKPDKKITISNVKVIILGK